MIRLTPTVKNLLIINVAVFFISMILPLNLENIMALRYIEARDFAPYQYFTYMFAHGSFMHLFSNMLSLFFLGPLLEGFWGSNRFLIFYLVTGIGAAVIYTGIEFVKAETVENKIEMYVDNPNPDDFSMIVTKHFQDVVRSTNFDFYSEMERFFNNPESPQLQNRTKTILRDAYDIRVNMGAMLGASGAIFGLLMAIAMLFPNVQFMLLIPPIPIRAKYLALILGGLELYYLARQDPSDNVAHVAHLGGMVFAFIMIKMWRRKGTTFH